MPEPIPRKAKKTKCKMVNLKEFEPDFLVVCFVSYCQSVKKALDLS